MSEVQPQGQRGAALTTLLLLVLVAGLAAAGWYGWQAWQGWQEQSSQQQQRLQALEATLAGLSGERQALDESLARLQTRLGEADRQIDALREGGQRDWIVNEAAALASLAQQRLLLTADLAAAERLLAAADKLLASTDDPAFIPVRRAFANDRQALEAARQVDMEGLVLQLAALQERVEALTLTDVTVTLAEPAPADPGEQDWWAALLARMPVRLEHADAPMPLPMNADRAAQLRLTLTTLMAQAQLALLQGRDQVYRQALAQAQQILDDWFPVANVVVVELRDGFSSLQQAPVEQALPEIGAGLAALRALQAGADS